MPKIKVLTDRCKGCGLCIQACPVKIIKASDELNVKGFHPAVQINPEKCTGCKLCAIVCPDVAIEVYVEEG